MAGYIGRIDKDPENFRRIVKESKSLTEVMIKLGYAYSAGNFRTIKRKIAKYGINTDHMLGCGWAKGKTRDDNDVIGKLTEEREPKWDDVFRVGSDYKNQVILARLIRSGKRAYACERCRLTEWNGFPIPLHLHHKNKIDNDNREENLEILCSNCHNVEHGYGNDIAKLAIRLGLLDQAAVSQFWQRTMVENHSAVGSSPTRRTTYKRTCLYCKAEFLAARREQKFCSCKCSNERRKAR